MVTSLRRCLGFILLATLLGCSSVNTHTGSPQGGPYGFTREYASRLIEQEMKKHQVEGLSIALVDDQTVVWAQGFGFADRNAGIPATPETVYRAGSVSKLFTATAAMQLAERGKLELDRPIADVVPEFSIKSRFPDAGPITPRLLMTHHSGLPSDLLKGMWNENPEPFENNVRYLKDAYLAFPPGSVFSYSNIGISLLGQAVERVAGRPFATHLNDAVLRPLGMTHSRFSVSFDRSPSASKAYRDGEEGVEVPLRDLPAGGLNSTVLDLSRFIEMVFAGGKGEGGQVLTTRSVGEMLHPQNAGVPLDLTFRIGLGWMLSGPGEMEIHNGGTVAHHSGATLYHRAMVAILPEHKLGVAVLANSSGATPVVSKVAAETLKLALEAKKGIVQPAPQPVRLSQVPLPAEELAAYPGSYATPAGVVRVERESDRLTALIGGKSLRLVPREDGFLALQYRLWGLIPLSLGPLDEVGVARAVVAGREILKARSGEQEMTIGSKIATPKISDAWRRRLGEYEIANLGGDRALVEGIRLKEEEGLLLIEYALPLFASGRTQLALAPVSDVEAVVQGVGRGLGETLRVLGTGPEEILVYSGYRLRKTVR